MIKLSQHDGTTLTLPQKPKIIISLVPSVTENLILFGKLPFARTAFCIEPAEVVKDIPVIGGTKTPRIPKVISMKPDLVIANREENIKAHVEEIQAAGIPVWTTYPGTVADLPVFMKEVAMLCDDSTVALNWIKKTQELLKQKFEWKRRPKIATLIWKNPWMAVGQDTYTSDLIRFCGADNPISGRYPVVTVDDIRQFELDILLLPNEPYAFKNEDFEFWKTVCPEVLSISGEDLLWSGTRWIKAVSTLTEICKRMAL